MCSEKTFDTLTLNTIGFILLSMAKQYLTIFYIFLLMMEHLLYTPWQYLTIFYI